MAADLKAAWAQAQETGSVWQLRLMRWMALHVPGSITDALIWAIALVYACQTGRPTTQASAAYLGRVLDRTPTLRERQIHARTFAHVFLDRARLLATGIDDFEIEVQGAQLIEDQHAAGRGGVFLGAHFGSFEALRAFDRTLPGLRVRYLMYPEHAPASTALLNHLNPEVASNVISLANGPQAMLEVHEALDRGEFVAFLGDRQTGGSTRSTMTVSFMGGMIDLPNSPYIAAFAARVPLYLCVAPRLGKKHYGIEISELYNGEPVARAERNTRIAELAQTYANNLERLCFRYPYNWFNFYDIWSK